MKRFFFGFAALLSSATVFSDDVQITITFEEDLSAPATLVEAQASCDKPAPPPEPCQPCPPPRPPCPCLCADPNSRIQIGGTYSYAHVNPSGNTITHGNLGGVQAIYEYRPLNRFYGAAEFTWREGTTTGPGVSRSILEFDAQERLGYTFGWCSGDTRLALFSGVGFRYLGESVISGGSKVTFNYDEFYLPLGFLFDQKCGSIVSVGVNFQWMPQVYPTLTIHPIGGARWVITKRLNNFLVELPLTFTLSEKHQLSLLLVPFFETWHDGQTIAKTAAGVPLAIPGNSYLFGGVNVNFAYSF